MAADAHRGGERAAAGGGPGATAERVLTRPLLVFLLAVAAWVGAGAWQRYRLPDLDGAVLELADGDLDGDERTRMLRHVLELARDSSSLPARWAGLLAAISLEDRAAHDALARSIGAQVPEPAARELLHLGEPLLGHLLAASVAEAGGARDDARRWWALVESGSRLERRELAHDLAVAARARLGD